MPTIFLHGLGQDHSSWDEVKKYLNKTDTITPNLTLLKSTKVLDYGTLYEEVKKSCQKLDGKVDLVGLSLGGVLALNYVVDFPDKVNSLVLINAQYKMPKLLLSLQNMMFRFMADEKFVSTGFSKADFIGICKSMKSLDFSRDLSRITTRTLVIHGENDKLNRKAAKTMHQMISNSRLEKIPGAGHIINTEKPRVLAEVLNRFYEEK